jgi:benzoyl-CoA 2,3-dioxygenase component A
MSATPAAAGAIVRQHLIDPEICIRCNTCEETCPSHAITHDGRNYVVSFERCKQCLACVPPCPTGAIDSWRNVEESKNHDMAAQFGWDTLPDKTALDDAGGAPAAGEAATADLPADVRELTDAATSGEGGAAHAPWSASEPSINLYTAAAPAIATVTGNHRLTGDDASADIRHIVLDFGTQAFPVLEGQSIGILAPGLNAYGDPHHVRLYSVASPREGERPHHNNLALTVKRVTEGFDRQPVRGVCLNYLCDLAKGDTVRVIGPFGSTFLMPNHPGSSLMMICTGTGSAPMRAMTERRRRRIPLAEGGRLMLFFGARAGSELPYFGPLMKLPADFIDINLAFSRVPGATKQYVQDLLRARADRVVEMLADDDCYVYVCGLKGMETGVIEAFSDICRARGLDWDRLRAAMLAGARLHIETY